MQFLVFIFMVPVAVPCMYWVFPEHGLSTDADCCGKKKFGEDLYLLHGHDNKAVDEYQCISNCTYTKEGESDQLYCFKYGNGTPECLASFLCTNDAVEELQTQWNKSLTNINIDIKEIMDFGANYTSHPHTFDQFLKEAMKLISKHVFSPEQQEVLRDSSPCHDLRHECDQCFATLLDSFLTCFKYNDPTQCNSTASGAHTFCKSCICEISRECNQTITCPLNNTKEPTDNSGGLADLDHPCDRPCFSDIPRKCVYNLNQERLYSDAMGRKVDGRNRTVTVFNEQIPGPPIVICEGDDLVVYFKNNMVGKSSNFEDTATLHFHGIREKLTPYNDGVPFVTQCPLLPNTTYTYWFNTSTMISSSPGRYTQAGTYYYHSHVGDQRTNGAYGALIIRPNKPLGILEPLFQVDNTKNTMILQEWYESPENQTVKSLLINGNGRVSTWTDNFTTNYTEFNIDQPGKTYLFRVIGAISQNFPLRLSIDDHTFTAIAADSQDIEPVFDLTDLWVAAGERFHISVNTKDYSSYNLSNAYKIRVFGYSYINSKYGPFCTIAWLKYPNQTIDYNYTTGADCDGFLHLPSSTRTLNPVPNNITEWDNRLKFGEWNNNRNTGNIFINDLRARTSQHTLEFFSDVDTVYGSGLNNTQYLELDGLTFNNISMNYTNVPFLLQDGDGYDKDQCGTVCKADVHKSTTIAEAEENRYLITNCSVKNPDKCTGKNNCLCPHVIQQPFAPGYWVDVFLINKDKDAAAHPIHVHGGWFWVMGMDKYEYSINSTYIQKQNQNCPHKDHCLLKNLTVPVAKDTIQVPPGGYVLLRIPLDNKGTWFMHCHVNNHLRAGMALVLQIGGFGKPKKLGQDWCTGNLKKNDVCLTPPPTPIDFVWTLPMEPTEKCVAPGTTVTFLVDGHHNVNKISKDEYDNCRVNNDANMAGEYVWPVPSVPEETTYYFACGIKNGTDCELGMRAIVRVKPNCK